MADDSENSSYGVRVSGDADNDALLEALEARPNMRIVVRGAGGMLPPEGSRNLRNDLPIKSYSLWVEGVGSEDEAGEAVEALLAEASVPGQVQDVRRLGD